MGLDFLEHAYMNEVLAYAIGAASLFGVVAPNSGNQTILVKYGTEEQKKKWLEPADRAASMRVRLLDDRARRARAPTRARSRPRARARRRRLGDQRAQVVHVERQARRLLHRDVPHRGRRRAGATRNGRMTQIIVPTRHAGRQHRARRSGVGPRAATTARSSTTTCACRSTNQLGRRGTGHQAAQDRLGAGRVYHCMNSIGQMWRAFDLMVERAIDARGARRQARDQAVHPGLHRRLVHRHPGRAADDDPLRARRWTRGGDPRTDISAIKIFVPGGLRARRRPRDPGVGRGGRLRRPAARGHVPGRAHAAHRRRSRRGAPDPHREERARRYHRGDGWDFGN